MVVARPNERQTPLSPSGATNSHLPHCLGSVLKSQIKGEHRPHVGRRPTSFLPEDKHPLLYAQEKTSFSFNSKTPTRNLSCSHEYMNKMIILWRKKLAQFFSLLFFLPHMAQATHFHMGLAAALKSSMISQNHVPFDVGRHRKDACHLNILGTE